MRWTLLAVTLGMTIFGDWSFAEEPIINPSIDFNRFLIAATEAREVRKNKRVSEERFIELCRTPGVIILDARSKEAYDLLHVKNAINLPFADINVESLRRILPNKEQTIVIYCNNNFDNAPKALPMKIAIASLNISTYIALHSYGYTNIFELGPKLDIHSSRIDFVGTKE